MILAILLILSNQFSIHAETQSEKRFSFMGIELKTEKKSTLDSLRKNKPTKFEVLQDEESFVFMIDNKGTTIRLETSKGKVIRYSIMEKVESNGSNTGKLFTNRATSLTEQYGLPIVVYSGMQIWKNQSLEIMVLEFSQLGNALYEIKNVCSVDNCGEFIKSRAFTNPEYLSCRQKDNIFAPCLSKDAKNLVLSYQD